MIRGLLFCSLFCFSSILIGQNPFDIKKPAQGSPPTVRKEAVKKPEAKPKAQTADTPAVLSKPAPPPKPAEGSSLIDMLELDKKTTTSKEAVSSTNIFDIKTPKGKERAKTVILPNPGKRQESGKESQAAASRKDPVIEIKEVDPPAENSANPVVDNTFIDIVPPSEETDIKEIKKELKSFGTASTNNQGEISKNAWFIIYIFLFLLAAIAINFNRSYPALLLKATYNQNQLRVLFKDAFKGNHMLIFGILYFLFIINAGIFIYQSFKLFQVADLSLYWAILIVIIVYLIRHLVLYIMGKVFPMEKEASFFNYTIGIHNLTAGLGLMLINILLSFIDPESAKMLIFSGLGIIIALYAMRQIRGLLNNIPVIVSRKLHFIIYLCAVEIAPWMILVRYLTT
ncbi:MAG: DUF4271 domain-containing protein [Saprospiraceae bacterium]|nr:DUF4271 domain-containing protein [Saprospiraceae bacterium]